jgi:hypothetical protein
MLFFSETPLMIMIRIKSKKYYLSGSDILFIFKLFYLAVARTYRSSNTE